MAAAEPEETKTYKPTETPGPEQYFYDVSKFAELQALIEATEIIAAEALAVEHRLVAEGVVGEVIGNFSKWAGSEQFDKMAQALEGSPKVAASEEQPPSDPADGRGGWLQWWNHHNPKDPARIEGLEWAVYGLVYQQGGFLESNGARCPETFKLLKAIPNIRVAGFSRLKPGTEIAPHTGHTGKLYDSLAFHLGLVIPEGECCGLQVGPEVHVWQEPRQAIVFDDTHRHSAWNRHAEKSRIVLYVDFAVEPSRWAGLAKVVP